MKTPACRTALLVASIKLAEKAIHFTSISKLQSDPNWGAHLYRRAVRCQRGAFRLQAWRWGRTEFTMSTQKDSNFAVALKGETITALEGVEVGKEEVIIKTASGRTFRMYHKQDCCESVKISRCYYPYVGNGIEVREATEEIQANVPSTESATRTTFCVNLGAYSTGFFVEWIGESNGYYSESVSFVEVFP